MAVFTTVPHLSQSSATSIQFITSHIYFMAVFTTVPHLSQSSATSIQFITSHRISVISILTLSFHLRRGFNTALFCLGLTARTVYAFFSPPHVPHVLPILCSLIISSGSTDHETPHYAVFPSLLFLPISYTQVPSSSSNYRIFSTLNARDQFSRLYQSGGKIINFVYFNHSVFRRVRKVAKSDC